MRRKRLVFAFVFMTLVYGTSSCEKLSITGHTVGLVKFVRPDVAVYYHGQKSAVFEDTRFLPDTEIEIGKGARTTLLFDSGVKVVTDGDTRIRALSATEIMLLRGRIFIDADEKEEMAVAVDSGKLGVIGSAVSMAVDGKRVSAYTYAGELTYNFAGGKGLLRAGESLTVDGDKVSTKPEELWADWTGGMAEAGPRAMESPVSIGQIYARLPGAQGMARWPLVIRRHEVRVTIKGDLAVTETMQEFFNPSSEVMEGIYRLSIPEDAILQRFAVDRAGRLVDGIIKEKSTAKKEYASHVYQGSTSDPALLEWTAPGSFRASIYPIKPGQVRVIAYRYSQWLKPSGRDGDVRTYVYPVGNETIAPKIGEFYFVADVADAGTDTIQAGAGARIEKGRVVFAQSDFRPRSDFYIQFLGVDNELEDDEILMVKADYRKSLLGIKGGEWEGYAWSQFVLRGDEFDVAPEKDLRISIALDMSAATEQHLVDLAATFVESLFGQLRETDRVAVFAGDIEAKIVGQDKKSLSPASAQVKDAVMDAVARHSIGGATDIGRLIMEAANVSAKEPGGVVIYIGDGFPTVGELDLGGLKERLKRLPNNVRLYGIALGDEANLDLLAGLCEGRGLARRIESRVDAAETAVTLLASASTPVVENLKYTIDGGVERVYPAELSTLRITEPIRLIGKLTGEKDPESVTVKGIMGGKPFTKEFKVKIKEFDDLGDLRLRWAEKRLLTLLEEQEGPESVIELGTRFGIITPYTSFYVPPEEESYNLPEAPTFEIFDLLDEAQSSAAGGGRGETTLAEALVGIFLPYGCCRSCGGAGDEAPSEEYVVSKQTAEEQQIATPVEALPVEAPSVGGSEGDDSLMGEEKARDLEKDNMYGIKGPKDMPKAGLEMAADEEADYKEAAEEPDVNGDYAVTGTGIGGGGTGEGTIGLSELSTIGHGGGGGSGTGYGSGAGGLRGKGGADVPKVTPGSAMITGNLSKEVVRRIIRQHVNELRFCYEQQLAVTPDMGGSVDVQFIIGPSGAVQAAKVDDSTIGNNQVESCVVKAFKRWTFPAPEGGGVVVVTYPLKFAPSDKWKEPAKKKAAKTVSAELAAAQPDLAKAAESWTKTKIYFEQEIYVSQVEPGTLSENVKQCTEAALMPVDEKKQLWRERLGVGPSMSEVMDVFRQAKKSCEIKTAKDQRAFARVVLGLLGGVSQKCAFYQRMKSHPALADYIRGKILASLSTPGAVKTAMEQCDSAVFLTDADVEKMLDKIKDLDGKIVALKKLIVLYPNDLDLKLRLLDMLEDAGRKEEAARFADAMRTDPYATDEVRTRIGELYVRLGEMEEAKRVLSEIVEFAPWSYEARRRLGDLYRTYGWHEDAYRQYETLSKMAPNDDVVLILLAEAAILAGRSDEGLRILEQVSQSEPSFEGKISPAEAARILASLTLAEMRVKARKDKDEKKLKKLVDRTRKAGVLRDEEKLKIVLKWEHPDAVFDLSIKFPGSELSRSTKSAPTLGLIWLTDKSKASGDILVQVERAPGSVIKESRATLFVIVDEGEESEVLETLEITLTKKDEPKSAWTVSPEGKISQAKVDTAEPL